MSMVECVTCGSWIDSDSDPACIPEQGFEWEVYCESCREQEELKHLMDEMERAYDHANA